jgi:hypothetical protein
MKLKAGAVSSAGQAPRASTRQAPRRIATSFRISPVTPQNPTWKS